MSTPTASGYAAAHRRKAAAAVSSLRSQHPARVRAALAKRDVTTSGSLPLSEFEGALLELVGSSSEQLLASAADCEAECARLLDDHLVGDACRPPTQSAERSPGEPNVYETHAIVSETATFSTCRGGGDAERRARSRTRRGARRRHLLERELAQRVEPPEREHDEEAAEHREGREHPPAPRRAPREEREVSTRAPGETSRRPAGARRTWWSRSC